MSVHAIGQHRPDRLVDVDDLICPGCVEPVVGEPPQDWSDGAGRRPEFIHADGSVLCPDSRGAIGEPVEATGLRFWLTEQACRELDPVRAHLGYPCCGQAVDYHGSLTDAHGRYVLAGPCGCSPCQDDSGPMRWALRSLHAPTDIDAVRVLRHVRPSSFTAVGGRS